MLVLVFKSSSSLACRLWNSGDWCRRWRPPRLLSSWSGNAGIAGMARGAVRFRLSRHRFRVSCRQSHENHRRRMGASATRGLLDGCDVDLGSRHKTATQKLHRDSIATPDLIRMLRSQNRCGWQTAIFLTSSPEIAPSALMHNLKHNKDLHERVWLFSVLTEDTPRVPASKRYQIEKLSEDSPA